MIIFINIYIYLYYQLWTCSIAEMWRLRLVPDARGCTESSLAPGLSAPHTLTRVPRAPEHQAPPSAPGGAIGLVLDCGDCDDFGWYQTPWKD